MEGLTQMTAVPKESVLGKEKVMLHPLAIRDWGHLEQWMRGVIVGSAQQAAQGLSDKARREILDCAFREAADVSLTACFMGQRLPVRKEGETDDEFVKRVVEDSDSPSVAMSYLGSFEGMLRVVHLSLKHEQPDITLEKVDAMIGQNLTTLVENFATVVSLSFGMSKSLEDRLSKKVEETED